MTLKILAIASLLFSPLAAFALTYEVIGPCSDQPAYRGTYAAGGLSVGKASLAIFTRDSIPFEGAENGMNSILGTPVGEDELEIINRQEMRAYGWCFTVDGKQSELMPDKVMLTGSENLRWYYAFAYYRAGQWESYCNPAYLLKPKKFCP